MSIEQLERDMADRFKVQRDALQKTNDRLDKLQTLLKTLANDVSITCADFITKLDLQKAVEDNEPAKQVSDVDFLKQRVEALEKSEMDLESSLGQSRGRVKELESCNEQQVERIKELREENEKLRAGN